MPDSPLVSFVVPTYNRADMLVRCLRAVDREGSSGIPFEVVVVDDGSDASTATQVRREQVSLAAPVQFLQQENSGPAAARNRGVEAAKGELIVFLGDDIVVEPGYLKTIFEAYLACPAPLHGMVGHTRYSSDSVSTPFGRWLDTGSDLQFAYKSAAARSPLSFEFFYTSNIIVPRRLLLDAGGFNEKFRFAAFEDTELGYRLQQRGFELYYCPSARAIHHHRVTVAATAARTRMTARAAMELRAINPELFALVFPRADERFGRSRMLRRFVRWAFAGPVLAVLTGLDDRLRLPLPARIYQLTMYTLRNYEMARLMSQLNPS